MNRRDFLRAGAVSLGALMMDRTTAAEDEMRPAASAVDHLLLGVSDLDVGIRWVMDQTGVKAVIGGVHPGRGTRNALISLGNRQYLEILAPDPAQKETQPMFELAGLKEPVLIAWAVSTTDIEALALKARKSGFSIEGPTAGSRNKADGSILRWKALSIASDFSQGFADPVPFFIQWDAGSLHPSQDSPEGCLLQSLALTHPRAEQLKETLARLGIDAEVEPAKTAGLSATLKTPGGTMTLGGQRL
jgi:hypothetical protein